MVEWIPLTASADRNNLESIRHLEIPVSAQNDANLLVQLAGVALFGSDESPWDQIAYGPDGLRDGIINGDIYIETDYQLKETDVWLPISSAWISLASIQADDEDYFMCAVDSVEVKPKADRVVQLHVRGAILGDASILRISYQANLLIHREK